VSTRTVAADVRASGRHQRLLVELSSGKGRVLTEYLQSNMRTISAQVEGMYE